MNWQPPNEPSPREKRLQAEIDALRATQRESESTPAAPGATTPGTGVPSADASPDAPPAPVEDAPPERPPFYCPACGRAMHVRIECVGRNAESPHPPVEVVPSDELDGDPAKHTPAPSTGE